MPTSFACPACRSVLKTKVEVPAGKKVKCPKCANIFAAPAADAKVAAAMRSGAPAASTGGARTDVRTGKPPALPAARRSAPRDDDEVREERRERKRSKKRKKKQSNLPLLLGIGGGGGALIAVIVILGFVWPGLFLAKEKTPRRAQPVVAQEAPKKADGLPQGTGQEDLLNFVPAGCNIFAGADLSSFDQNPETKKQWHRQITTALRFAPGAPPGLSDIAGDVERVLVAVNVNEKTGVGGSVSPEGLLVVRMKSAYTPEKILNLMQSGKEPVQKNGRTVYLPMGVGQGNEPVPMVYMHNDRVLLVAVAPPQRLDKMLEFNEGNSALNPEALAIVRGAEKAMFWGALQVTPTVREQLAKIDPNMLAGMGPELVPAVPAIQNMKAATITLDRGADGKSMKYQITVTCASDAEGQQMQTAVKDFWEKKGKMSLPALKMFAPPNTAQAVDLLVNDITNNLTITAQGQQVSVALELSGPTLQAMAALSNQLPQMMGGGAMRGGPGMQPGQQPPGRPQGGRPPRGRPAGR
jgi:hypothetical protein